MVIKHGPVLAYVQLEDLLITVLPSNENASLLNMTLAISKKTIKPMVTIEGKTKEYLINLFKESDIKELTKKRRYAALLYKNKKEIIDYIENFGGFYGDNILMTKSPKYTQNSHPTDFQVSSFL